MGQEGGCGGDPSTDSTGGTSGTGGGTGTGGTDGTRDIQPVAAGIIAPGQWLGFTRGIGALPGPNPGVTICFHVNEDGTALTPDASCGYLGLGDSLLSQYRIERDPDTMELEECAWGWPDYLGEPTTIPILTERTIDHLGEIVESHFFEFVDGGDHVEFKFGRYSNPIASGGGDLLTSTCVYRGEFIGRTRAGWEAEGLEINDPPYTSGGSL